MVQAARLTGDKSQPAAPTADATVASIGQRIRDFRLQRAMTLQVLSQRTGLSSSMLSLVERGRTSPSVGSLVAISSALGIHMSDLFADDSPQRQEPVIRKKDQPVFAASDGVQRRIVRIDDGRGIELVINDYEPGTGSGGEATRHGGHEYGVLLDGSLTVELDGEVHELKPGDSISYASSIPHRIVNKGKKHARAVWLNVTG